MTKIGAHVITGSRNGYGEFVAASPAVVVAMGEGGALLEAKEKSGGTTTTVFRHNVYKDAPHGIDQADEAWAIRQAEADFPRLAAQWDKNPADYYIVLNEPAGNNESVMPVYVAYEKRIVDLAQGKYRICVLNLATGTPWNVSLWDKYYVPYIKYALERGHVYGRHAYGHDGRFFDDRGFHYGGIGHLIGEIKRLRQVISNPRVIVTELGVHDEKFYGTDSFVRQAALIDDYFDGYDEIIGGALWTLGDGGGRWAGANWQDATRALAQYLLSNKDNKPPDPTPEPEPDPGATLEQAIWSDSVSTQQISLNKDAALQGALLRSGYAPVGSEHWISYGGKQYAYQAGESLSTGNRAVVFAEVPKWNSLKYIFGKPSDEPAPPPPPPDDTIDMSKYFIPLNGDKSRVYIIRNNWGQGDERVQLQYRNGVSKIVKNQQWEARVIRDGYWHLVADTSPGNNSFYTVEGAWMPVRWRVGGKFLRREQVRYYRKDNCSMIAQGDSESVLHFRELKDISIGGHFFKDVAVLQWILTDGSVEEVYYYAPRLGLVKWVKPKAGFTSEFAGFVPEHEEDNVPERINCGVLDRWQ